MNFKSITICRLFWSSIGMTLFLFLVTGCKVEDKTWIDKMVSDVGLAVVEADKAGLGQDGRDAALVKAAHKYFPAGMRKEDAFVLLREMKNSGFDISEYRHDGTRKWPAGALKSYMDEATRRNLQSHYPPRVSEVIAVRTWRSRLVVEEFFQLASRSKTTPNLLVGGV